MSTTNTYVWSAGQVTAPATLETLESPSVMAPSAVTAARSAIEIAVGLPLTSLQKFIGAPLRATAGATSVTLEAKAMWLASRSMTTVALLTSVGSILASRAPKASLVGAAITTSPSAGIVILVAATSGRLSKPRRVTKSGEPRAARTSGQAFETNSPIVRVMGPSGAGAGAAAGPAAVTVGSRTVSTKDTTTPAGQATMLLTLVVCLVPSRDRALGRAEAM